jgi:hypothetical protein
MDTNATPLELLFNRAEEYGKTTVEVLKLNSVGMTAEIASSLAVKFTIFTVVALFTFIINIAISLWLGELTGKTYYGFLIVATLYALLAIILYIFRNQWIKIPVSNSVILQLLKKKGN